ncbi:LysR family transcriptional regulator [Rhodobacteraceae bacterium CH30]|nr:LysR family transcriptional regulator [Rhodobacteraceae bacterium CH30]
MLNVDALIAFCTVIDAGSFSAAAERLGQTPSGVSRTISRLESQLGISLITRTTRRLDLTEEGRWLLERARSILAELAETEAQLANSRAQPSGLVRVNAATPVLVHLVAPLVAGFLEHYPQVKLELNHGETVIDLIEERADVAIRLGTLSDSTLNARRLGETPQRLVAAPAYLARCGTPASAEALAAHRLLGFTQPASLNLWPLRHAGGDGWPARPSLAASSGETLYRLALEGAGIACLSDFLVKDALAQGKLCEVLPQARLHWNLPVWAVFYRQGGLAPRVAAFVDYLAQHLPARLG